MANKNSKNTNPSSVPASADTAAPVKKPKKQTEQERLLEIQDKLAPKSRIADIITVIGLLVTIYFLSLFTIFYPDSDFSETENRPLQQKPALSTKMDGSIIDKIKAGKFLDRLISGDFTSEISKYFQDQLPMRNTYVQIKAVTETIMLKQEVNGVLLGKDENIISRKDYVDTTGLDKNLICYDVFAAEADRLGVPVTFALAGRSMDVLSSYTPSLYGDEFSNKIWAYFDAEMNKISRPYVNLLTPLKEKADAGEYVYYHTDHHWTSLGAYYAYSSIIEEMGGTPQDITAFTRETASDAFYGTTWSTAGVSWISADTMEYFRYDGDTDYTLEIVDNGKTMDGFYDRSYLEVKDKYSSFISGNNAHVRITKNTGDQRETLLVVKDSYAHSVMPFLAYHYDLEIIDLRYYKQEAVINLLKDGTADRVLFLFNMDNITAAQPVLNLLRWGIE